MGLACPQGLLDCRAIHPSHHQDFARIVLLRYCRDQSIAVERQSRNCRFRIAHGTFSMALI
jgi:hypothetical protein